MLFVLSILFVGSGISLVSGNISSATFELKAASHNSDAIAVFSSSAFQLYGNGIPFSNGTAYNFFPTEGSNSVDIVTFSVSYSKAAAFLWSYVAHGGAVNYALTGTASFSTPIGEAELPLNVTTRTSSLTFKQSSAELVSQAGTVNDALVAAFTNATFQMHSNGIRLANLTSSNLIPPGKNIPKVSIITTDVSIPYSSAAASIGDYLLHLGAANLGVNGTASFETFYSVGGTPTPYPVDIPIAMNVTTGGSELIPVALLVLLAVFALMALFPRRFRLDRIFRVESTPRKP